MGSHPATPDYIHGVGEFNGVRCSTHNAPAPLLEDARKLDASSARVSTMESISIKTYVHVVTTEASRDNFTQQMVDDQITALNDAYQPLSISYELVNTSYTVNDRWASAEMERDMKAYLRQGAYADLNLYFLSHLGGALLGFCYFPEVLDGTGLQGNDTLVLDGCVNLAGSLPGGLVVGYNEGKTAVHETGHWLGLFHVFQGSSCHGPGDYTDDTPIQMNATRGCPKRANSCPQGEGLDNIHSFMDYSSDACMTVFTEGQGRRTHSNYLKYRAGR